MLGILFKGTLGFHKVPVGGATGFQNRVPFGGTIGFVALAHMHSKTVEGLGFKV